MRSDFDVSKYFIAIVIEFFLFYGLLLAAIFIGSTILFFLNKFSIEFSLSIKNNFILLIVFIVWYLYFFIMFKKTGQTFAMRIFKLKIQSVKSEMLFYRQVIWWGIFIPIPVTLFFEILNMRVPPYRTLLESRTNTIISEV